MKITIMLKRTKCPAHIQRALDQILFELEKYGRAHTTNGTASRFLAHRMKTPKNQEKVYFSWNKQHQKSIITLAADTSLERVSDNKVKIIYQKGEE